MPSLSEHESVVYPSDTAAHIDRRVILVTADLARGLLAGKQYLVGNQVIGAVPTEREMLKRANWAARAIEVRS